MTTLDDREYPHSQCIAICISGDRCKNAVMAGTQFCFQLKHKCPTIVLEFQTKSVKVMNVNDLKQSELLTTIIENNGVSETIVLDRNVDIFQRTILPYLQTGVLNLEDDEKVDLSFLLLLKKEFAYYGIDLPLVDEIFVYNKSSLCKLYNQNQELEIVQKGAGNEDWCAVNGSLYSINRNQKGIVKKWMSRQEWTVFDTKKFPPPLLIPDTMEVTGGEFTIVNDGLYIYFLTGGLYNFRYDTSLEHDDDESRWYKLQSFDTGFIKPTGFLARKNKAVCVFKNNIYMIASENMVAKYNIPGDTWIWAKKKDDEDKKTLSGNACEVDGLLYISDLDYRTVRVLCFDPSKDDFNDPILKEHHFTRANRVTLFRLEGKLCTYGDEVFDQKTNFSRYDANTKVWTRDVNDTDYIDDSVVITLRVNTPLDIVIQGLEWITTLQNTKVKKVKKNFINEVRREVRRRLVLLDEEDMHVNRIKENLDQYQASLDDVRELYFLDQLDKEFEHYDTDFYLLFRYFGQSIRDNVPLNTMRKILKLKVGDSADYYNDSE
jgi:hypothetical protein